MKTFLRTIHMFFFCELLQGGCSTVVARRWLVDRGSPGISSVRTLVVQRELGSRPGGFRRSQPRGLQHRLVATTSSERHPSEALTGPRDLGCHRTSTRHGWGPAKPVRPFSRSPLHQCDAVHRVDGAFRPQNRAPGRPPVFRASAPRGTLDRCRTGRGGIPQHLANPGVAGGAAISRPGGRLHLADRGQTADGDRRLNGRPPHVETPADNLVPRVLLHPGRFPRGCDHATTSSTHSPPVPRRGY